MQASFSFFLNRAEWRRNESIFHLGSMNHLESIRFTLDRRDGRLPVMGGEIGR
jgi:hypothetical protein